MIRTLTLTTTLFLMLCGSASADFVFDAFSSLGGTTISGATVTPSSGFVADASGGYDIEARFSTPASITYKFLDTVANTYASGGTPNYNIDLLYVPFDFGANVGNWKFELLGLNSGDDIPSKDLIFEVASLTEDQPFRLTETQAMALGDSTDVTFQFSYQVGNLGDPLVTGTFGGSNSELFANPEPTSALMLGTLVGMVGFVRRRRRIETIKA